MGVVGRGRGVRVDRDFPRRRSTRPNRTRSGRRGRHRQDDPVASVCRRRRTALRQRADLPRRRGRGVAVVRGTLRAIDSSAPELIGEVAGTSATSVASGAPARGGGSRDPGRARNRPRGSRRASLGGGARAVCARHRRSPVARPRLRRRSPGGLAPSTGRADRAADHREGARGRTSPDRSRTLLSDDTSSPSLSGSPELGRPAPSSTRAAGARARSFGTADRARSDRRKPALRARRGAGCRTTAPTCVPVSHSPCRAALANLLGRRLSRLSSETRGVLLVVALAGRPTIELIAAAHGDPAGALAALAEAGEAGVVERTSTRVRFTHPLFASVLHDQSSPDLRTAVHRALARGRWLTWRSGLGISRSPPTPPTPQSPPRWLQLPSTPRPAVLPRRERSCTSWLASSRLTIRRWRAVVAYERPHSIAWRGTGSGR